MTCVPSTRLHSCGRLLLLRTDLKFCHRGRISMSNTRFATFFVALLSLTSIANADNFCRTSSDFQSSTIATGSTTCSALSSYLLGKVSGSPSTWADVSCAKIWSTAWRDGAVGNEVKSIAEHLWEFGTKCCGSQYKTMMATTCNGCSQVGGAGKTVDAMGWYHSGSGTMGQGTSWQVASPGAGIKTGGGTGLGVGSFCPFSGAKKMSYNQTGCNTAAWTNKKHGDGAADAPTPHAAPALLSLIHI